MTKTDTLKPKASKPRRRAIAKTEPRVPSRARGKARYENLLDALDSLLSEFEVADIGLYQIAVRADVPPGSVYHFFRTKEAALLGLAQRYMRGLDRLNVEPASPAALRGWQGLLEAGIRQAVAYFNGHPAAMKLLLGFSGGTGTMQANSVHTASTGRRIFRLMDAAFVMPAIRDVDFHLDVAVRIIESMFVMSYLSHGRIEEKYVVAAVEASQAYCRLYFPHFVDLRPEVEAELAKAAHLAAQ